MSDERLAREHTAWLGAVLRGHAPREDVEPDEPRAASPDEVAAALGRRERELTPDDAAALRRTPDEEPDDAPEETSDFEGFLADLRRQRRKTPSPTSESEDT